MFILEIRDPSYDINSNTPCRRTFSFNSKEELIKFLGENPEELQESAQTLNPNIIAFRQENNLLRLRVLKNYIKFYNNIYQLLLHIDTHLRSMVKEPNIASEIMDTILKLSQTLMDDE